LTWLAVDGGGAATGEAATVSAVVALLFLLSFVSLAARPHEAVVGYKG
jgi:hypothetical protein